MGRLHRRSIAIVSACAVTVSLVACTGNDSDPDVDQSSTVVTSPPDEEDETPDVDPFETEPEFVDVPVPDAVDLGEPTEVDGREYLPSVDLDAAVSDAALGVTVWLEDFTAVDEAGSRPGEIGGPAIQFDVLIHNGSTEPLDLATLVVAVAYGDSLIPAEPVVTHESRPLSGEVSADSTIRGTLVFVVPLEERAKIIVNVDLASDSRIVLFEGEAPE